MKLKTRKSALKRIKIKKNILTRKKAYKGHLLRKKDSKRIRTLSQSALIHSSDMNTFYKMIPYH
jgi:large subunit ribosomal protein L35